MYFNKMIDTSSESKYILKPTLFNLLLIGADKYLPELKLLVQKVTKCSMLIIIIYDKLKKTGH